MPIEHDGANSSHLDGSTGGWVGVIWREWRHLESETAAQPLYELVASRPIGVLAVLVMALLWGIVTGSAGLLIYVTAGTWLSPESQGANWAGARQSFSIGSAIGVGLLLVPHFLFLRRITADRWLRWLTAGKLTEEFSLSGAWPTLGLAVAFGLPIFIPSWVAIRLALDCVPLGTSEPIHDLLAAILTAVVAVLFLGILLLGRSLLMWQLWAAISFLLVFCLFEASARLGHDLVGVRPVCCMLLGLVMTVLFGVSACLLPEGSRRSVHRHRNLYFWWRKRPALTTLENALQRSGQANAQLLLDKIRQQKAASDSFEDLIDRAARGTGAEQLLARYALVAMGGEVVYRLIDEQARYPGLQDAVRWLIEAISLDTTIRLEAELGRLTCPDDFHRFRMNKVYLGSEPFTICGCRECLQSRRFHRADTVIALLDEDLSWESETRAGEFLVNWLVWRDLFDFDRVELGRVADKAVEEFVLQVKQDQDSDRKNRYSKMNCRLNSNCTIAQVSVHLLMKVFGSVTK